MMFSIYASTIHWTWQATDITRFKLNTHDYQGIIQIPQFNFQSNILKKTNKHLFWGYGHIGHSMHSHVFTVPVTSYTYTWALPLYSLPTTDVAAQKKEKKTSQVGQKKLKLETKRSQRGLQRAYLQKVFSSCSSFHLSISILLHWLVMGAYRDLNPRLQKSGRCQQGETTRAQSLGLIFGTPNQAQG